MALTKPVTFEAAGETFTLTCNFAALCRVESDLNMGFQTVLASLRTDARLNTLVVLFRALLLAERPEVTADETMELIEEIGPIKAGEMIAEAIAQSPMFKPGNAAKIIKANPPKKAA